MTVEKTEERLSESTIELVGRYPDNWKKLSDRGFTMKLAAFASPEKLGMLLAAGNDYHTLFNLITIDQIIGKSHKPPAEHFQLHDRFRNLPDNTRVTLGPFTIRCLHNAVRIVYKVGTPEAKEYTGFEQVNYLKELHDDNSTSRPPEENNKYIHNWSLLSKRIVNGQIRQYRYSRDLYLRLSEIFDKDFPFAELLKVANIAHYIPTFYEEQLFCSQFTIIEGWRGLVGMTSCKLTALMHHKEAFAYLLEHGISGQDLARVSSIRLQQVLEHFEVAKIAFALTSIEDVLGLKDLDPHIKKVYGRLFQPYKDLLESETQSATMMSKL